MDEREFPCTKCGVCCKNIAGIPELKDFDRGNGICQYLDTQSNQCRIYLTRPKICRIDAIYHQFFSKHYTKEEFYTLNLQACKILQETMQ